MRAVKSKHGVVRPFVSSYGLGIVVLIIGLLLTAWAWHRSMLNTSAIEQVRFQHATEQAEHILNERLKSYISLVKSGQAFYASSEHVGLDEWRSFVNHLAPTREYPAVVNFDYLAHVPEDDLATYRQRMHTLMPGFNIKDVGPQPLHCVVQYEQPPRKKHSGLGYDICTYYQGIRSTLKQTETAGSVSVSQPIQLPVVRPGFKYKTVVVVAGAIVSHGHGHSGRLNGWITAQLALHTLFTGIVSDDSPVYMKVLGTEDTQGNPVLFPAKVSGKKNVACDGAFWSTPCLKDAVPVDLPGGRHWDLMFYKSGDVARSAWIIAVAGLLVSVLLMLLLFRLGRLRTRALALAKRMTQTLRENQSLLESVTNNISDGIYRINQDYELIYVNDSMVRMFGYHNADEMLKHWRWESHVNFASFAERHEAAKQSGTFQLDEVELTRRDGSRFTAVIRSQIVRDDAGAALYWDGAISDITARKAVEERAWYLARYDSLTGLSNQSNFRERVRQAIADASRTGQRFAILYLDLDRFKTVNDYFGQNAGDKLLESVSIRISASIGPDDMAGRQSGDEFLVLLSDIGRERDVIKAAERIQDAVTDSYRFGAGDVAVTASVGISIYPTHSDTVDVLIRSADTAMLHAKAQGRNNVQLFTPELDIDHQMQVAIEKDLREALRKKQFSLHYQPQVDMETGKIVAAEALLRWHHPERGMIPPYYFIPVAEQSGLIIPIGEWVLREACRQNREWQDAGLSIVPIAVNLSAVQFLRESLDKTIIDVIEEVGLEPHYLELELTETAVMQDIERTIEKLQRLQRIGIQFAIDDFGTGYSSLSYLHWFKTNKLKIDQSFVQESTINPDDAVIIHAIIGLAKSFQLEVVAEGVETKEQLEFVRSSGCDTVQGYYYSRPVPAEAFFELLKNGIAEPEQ